MKRLLLPLTLLMLVLTLAACGDDDEEPTPAADPPSEAAVEPSAGEAQDPPLVGGFHDGEPVDYLLTDVNIEKEAEGLSEATGFPVSFVEQLSDVPESATAKLYLFMNGVEGPNPFGFQPNVIDSVPGDPGYSPLWLVHAVEWTDESAARELRSEQEILAAEKAGELTITKTELIKNSPVVDDVPPRVGGFHDGEPVDYLLTDVNIEKEAEGLSEATGFPVSFVEQLSDVPESATAKLYLFMNGVEGPNPFGFQPNVIDSVPGDPGYSPLWLVHAVEWTDESAARELRSEQEILAAEKAGELTITKTELIKNSPVVSGLAGEGSTADKPDGSAAGAGGADGVTITTAESQFGPILFDGDDRAIYYFDKESSEESECYGACAEAWPPVLTGGEPEAAGDAGTELLGTTERDDGSTQVTYDGHPLYYYVDDPAGEALCHNVDEFGGLWLVVEPGGDAVQ